MFFLLALFTGPMIAILMLLPSLNSCVNPWIYIYFNPNLVSSFVSLFTRRTSSNSNLHSIGGGGGVTGGIGGKNSNSGGTTTAGNAGKSGRLIGTNNLQGHQRLTKMLTSDSAECSNSMDSRSMQGNNSRLDLLTAAKETQQFGKGGVHGRSVLSSFRPGTHQQMKSCCTGTDMSVDCDTKSTTMTTVTMSTTTNNGCSKLESVSASSTAFNDAAGNNDQHQPSLAAHSNTVSLNHQPNHLHVNSNMSSMSNLNEESGAETETMATYESTVTLNTNSTVTTAGRGCSLLCQQPTYPTHPQGRLLKSKSVVASVHSVKVRKPRRRISIQLDKMWSKIAAPNKRSSLTNSSQIDLYQSRHSEQFTV